MSTPGWFINYQTGWLADPARLKVVVKARRIGFSEVVSFECACRAVGLDIIRGRTVPPVPQSIVSASAAQSKALLARIAKHLTAFGAVGTSVIDGEAGKTQITLRNGITITAFSSNPATIRGEGGDVTLDEFAAMPNPDAVWAAVQPIAAATLAKPEGYNIRVVGTPLGDGNRFHRITRGDLSSAWSVHEVSIHDAIRDGFPANVEALREDIGDPDLFAQEYELAFLSANARYISAELYDSCGFTDLPPIHGRNAGAGMDVARRVHKSVITELHADADHVLWVRACEARRDQTWESQEQWAAEVIGRNRALAVDASGLGSQFAERLTNRFGSTVIPVTFTLQSKEDLATGLKLALERSRLRVPANNPDLRRAVLSIRRTITKAGNVVFDAAATKHGHADEGWSLMLAVHAAGGAATSVGRVPRIFTLDDLARAQARESAATGAPYTSPFAHKIDGGFFPRGSLRRGFWK